MKKHYTKDTEQFARVKKQLHLGCQLRILIGMASGP